MSYCTSGDDRLYATDWSTTRCSFKSLRVRALVYNNNSPCASPFAPQTNIQAISYFPVSGYKIEDGNNNIEDNKAYIDVVCDRTQDVANILSSDNKLILIDSCSKQILCTGKIRGYDKFSSTDVSVTIALIRDQYKYSQVFSN